MTHVIEKFFDSDIFLFLGKLVDVIFTVDVPYKPEQRIAFGGKFQCSVFIEMNRYIVYSFIAGIFNQLDQLMDHGIF